MQSETSFASGLPLLYYEIFNALDELDVESVEDCRAAIIRIWLVRSHKIRSRQLTSFQNAGSAEIKQTRMIILGCPV